jgi:hypothetical protein
VSGVKLKAEGELGFEPSLLVHMEREQDLGEHEISHVAHVLKDRRPDAKSLDGKSIINPTFAHFLPHIEYLNLGGRQFAFDDKASSAASIPEDERFSADTGAPRAGRSLLRETLGAFGQHGVGAVIRRLGVLCP